MVAATARAGHGSPGSELEATAHVGWWPKRVMRILVLYWDQNPGQMRLAVRQHLYALETCRKRHQVIYWNVFHGMPAWLKALPAIDAVVLHTILLCARWGGSELFQSVKQKVQWVRSLECAKIALPQDDYDHSEVLDEWLSELGITSIFTIFDEQHRELLYPRMSQKARFHGCFTGYIDEQTAARQATKILPMAERPHDIVYRASRLPYWFGRQGQLKHRIADVFAERAKAHGLTCDISTRAEDAIIGERWLDFLASGRTVIGCESGSSVLDRRGELRARIQSLSSAHPNASFEEISKKMPDGWDSHELVMLSPRHLEAVITKTCQVLVEGHYSGVLRPYEHYIPLRRDFSNVDEVLEQVRDTDLLRRVAERAYCDIFLSGRYTLARFAQEIESAITGDRARESLPAVGSTGLLARVLWRLVKAAARLSEEERQIRQRFLRRPLIHLLKASVALKLLAASHDVWRLIRHVLSKEQRKRVRLSTLLMDLVLLCLLQQAKAGRLPELPRGGLAVRFFGERGVLFFESKRDGRAVANGHSEIAPAEITADDLEGASPLRIIWDHSAIGARILYPLWPSKRIAFVIGNNGVYEFKALARLGGPVLRVLEELSRTGALASRCEKGKKAVDPHG